MLSLAWIFHGCSPLLDRASFESEKGYPDGIALSSVRLLTNMDITIQLTATIIGGSGEYDEIEWRSSDPSIATVDQDGLVTPSSLGYVTIIAKTVYGRREAMCDVIVNPVGTVAGVSIPQSLSLDVNPAAGPSTATLTAAVLPENASNKTIAWHSENSDIATVSGQGVVSALFPGTTTIRAVSVSNNSIVDTCSVTVQSTPSSVKRSFDVDLGNAVFADYSRSLDRIVAIGASSDRITVIDPASGVSSVANLPRPPLSLGLAPDGLKAAVGYDDFVGTVDLSGGYPAVTHDWPLANITHNRNGAIAIVALDQAGYAYCVDKENQWINMRQMNTNDGTNVIKSNLFYADPFMRIHKAGTSIYLSQRKVSSSQMYRVDVSSPAPAYLPVYSKSDTGADRFWFFDSGNAMIGSNSDIRSITQNSATDLALLGNIRSIVGGNCLEWADHNSLAAAGGATGMIAAISSINYLQNYYRNVVFLIGDSDFTLKAKIILPGFSSGGAFYQDQGKYCFWNSAGTELYVLVQSAGNPNSWRLVVY